jgi:multidrug efflux pump subunit AcrB
VLLSQGAASVTLGNVADVVEAPEPPIGGAAVQGRPGVILNVSEQYAANTVEVTKGVEAALQDLRPVLQADGITLQADLFRPANFINTATSNVRESLMLGAVLVTLVIFLFLFDLRMAAISCTAIPLSLLAGTIVLERSEAVERRGGRRSPGGGPQGALGLPWRELLGQDVPH